MMVEFCILEKLFEFEGMYLEFVRKIVVHESMALDQIFGVLGFCSESVVGKEGFEFLNPVGDGFL